MKLDPTLEMIAAGRHALYKASARDFDATDEEIEACWRAMVEKIADGVLATPARQATDEEIRAWLAQQKVGSISVSETRCLPAGVMGTQADQLLRDLVGAHAEWDALHWSQRNQPGAADKLLEARRKARDYVAAAGVPGTQAGAWRPLSEPPPKPGRYIVAHRGGTGGDAYFNAPGKPGWSQLEDFNFTHWCEPPDGVMASDGSQQ